MRNNSATPDQIISLPKGGGALHGIGETFSPDLHTGTGNFTVPISLPPGRNGFQPKLNLIYSTGNGNGAYGLGWSCSVPGVARRVSKGVPRYNLDDVFILSGAEDLVPVEDTSTKTRYRPRTEGLFARIDYHHDVQNKHDYWEVRSKDGLVSLYGVPGTVGEDPAVVADPRDRTKVFAWKLTQTLDPFGNRIEYEYEGDLDKDGPHHWDQVYLKRIRYADYTAGGGETKFLVSAVFEYEDRPDPFSEYRSGFEIRTRKRCTQIEIRTHADLDRLVRVYHMTYLDQRSELNHLQPLNGVSLLSQIKVVGHDGDRTEELPPLEFSYTRFEPQRRDFFSLEGTDLPAHSLANPDMELVDLFGNGLPCVLEMNGAVRYWRNLGNGRLDLPREMKNAPAGLRFSDSGVQLIDANGDGRTDLLVTTEILSGYFALRFDGLWDRRSFRRYRQAPSFNLEDPEVRLVDLDGDGVTDAVRSGARIECFFNDPTEGWNGTRRVERQALDQFSNIDFSDPRVKWADMTGDALRDIVLVYDGNVEYWPTLGRGDWGKRIHMRNSPRFPYGYDPKRVLIGDVDGDGAADVVYVDDKRVFLWVNQSGNGWSDPVVIEGTPPVSDMDAVRLTDILGSGIGGVLWTRDRGGVSRNTMFFLDFTGGIKPGLLNEMNNHMGAVTKVDYAPSTRFYLEDQKQVATRWKTPLPFPVQTVARVEVIDEISKGKLTTEYRYRHGYWDGAEREFRGFGRVDMYDTEVFEVYNQSGLHGDEADFIKFDTPLQFSPPTLTKTWFQQGPVGDEIGEWDEIDFTNEFWSGDTSLLSRPPKISAFLNSLPRRAKRDALRALRGSILRTELYAQDGTPRQKRPYTVSENLQGICEVVFDNGATHLRFDPQPEDSFAINGGGQRQRIFFPHSLGQRRTQWERGDDPATQFSFIDDYDDFGQPRRQTQVACPRGWRNISDVSAQPFPSTRSRTVYAIPQSPDVFIFDRVAKTTTYEIQNDGSQSLMTLKGLPDDSAALKVIGQTLNYYDGPEFVGLPLGEVDEFGALVRSENLVLTTEILHNAYRSGDELANPPAEPPYLARNLAVAFNAEYPAEFRDYLPALAGYVFRKASQDSVEGYFINAIRRKYDFHNADVPKRGLVVAQRDPLATESDPSSRDTLIAYDSFDVLPIEVTDPVGLTTHASYDYRVFQPNQVIDLNGNRTAVAYTPHGLLESMAIMGKDDENLGDSLAHPSVYRNYGFLAFDNSPTGQRQPVFVRTIRREHHDSETDISLPERDNTVITIEYSDGFGRLLQTRTQAEDVIFGNAVFGGDLLPLEQDDPHTNDDIVGIENPDTDSPNVTVSGWQIYDNKGRVVEKFEPFFSAGWSYYSPNEERNLFGREVLGQKTTIFYNPLGGAIRTLNPDGSEQRFVQGVPGSIAVPRLSDPNKFEPTPWETYTYDANDNAGRTHGPITGAYRHHWDTPTSVLIDPLGRTVKAVARNREKPANSTSPLPAIAEHCTLSTYDIQGNLLTVTDPLARVAFRHEYDLAKRPLRITNIDAGVRRIIRDASGNVVEQRDSKGALILRAYDCLNRPLRFWARDNAGGDVTLRQRLEYGDAGSPLQSDSEREANRSVNRLGKLHRHYDEAGLMAFEAYDFKGNILDKVRQVIADAAVLAAFESQLNESFRVDWDSSETTFLDLIKYRTTVAYDALNRVRSLQYPLDVEGERKAFSAHYNHAGALERVSVGDQTFVERIAYNAKGQRSFIAYGNGVMTRYAYDAQTFRLTRMRTERYATPNNLSYGPAGGTLQDLVYEYDLSGNILKILDRTPGSGVLNNPEALMMMEPRLTPLLAAGDLLIRRFEYDPIYRLISATGRECDNMPRPRAWTDDERCGFDSGKQGTPNQNNAPSLTSTYREEYVYDPAGNMVSLKHVNGGGSWVRNFGMGGLTPQKWQQEWQAHFNTSPGWFSPPGNRLTHVGDDDPAIAQNHFYDSNGNLVGENTERHFQWDHSDRLSAFRTQPVNAQSSIYAHYSYDADGQRLSKLVRKGAQVEITIYVDSIFEHHRLQRNGLLQENNTLHVMDNQNRVALVRIGLPLVKDASPPVKFQLGDHLGSSNVVVGDAGHWISHEEYTPYGETSFGSFAKKRYRFAGKERDEVTGLYYHRTRYSAPWLGRWTGADPDGLVDGANVYLYCRNNPIKLRDPHGTQSKPVNENEKIEQMTDPQLYRYLHGLTKEERGNVVTAAAGATGAFRNRALAMVNKYQMERSFTLPEVTVMGAPHKGKPFTMEARIVIIKGSSWESQEMRSEIHRQIANAERIWGIKINTPEAAKIIDQRDMLHVSEIGEEETDILETHEYTKQATDFMNKLGNEGKRLNLVFTDYIGWKPNNLGKTVLQKFAKSGDDVRGEGAYITKWAEGKPVVAHELGHALAGVTDPPHEKTDMTAVMYPGGGDRPTEPWKSQILESDYLQ
jgi:RHS repeat-associated protein